jgi:RNA 2',3'-cyclic 3'-phosphodiesterase
MKAHAAEENIGSDAYRLFVALPVAGSAVKNLQRLQARLDSMSANRVVRWTRLEQLHLTLHFLGDVRSDQVPGTCRLLEQACEGARSFSLRLQGLGCFPLRGPVRVVWVGIQGAVESLRSLQSSVAQRLSSLGSQHQSRPFAPHLTIGRVRAGAHPPAAVRTSLAGLLAIEVGDWPIDEVVLMRSELRPEGARYTRLLTVHLPGGEERTG